MTWSLVVSSGSDFQVLEDSVGRLEYVCGVEVDIPEGFGCDISSCMQRTSIRCDDEVELNKTSFYFKQAWKGYRLSRLQTSLGVRTPESSEVNI